MSRNSNTFWSLRQTLARADTLMSMQAAMPSQAVHLVESFRELTHHLVANIKHGIGTPPTPQPQPAARETKGRGMPPVVWSKPKAQPPSRVNPTVSAEPEYLQKDLLTMMDIAKGKGLSLHAIKKARATGRLPAPAKRRGRQPLWTAEQVANFKREKAPTR
ncbi:MAG: hypothetical protein ACRCV9_09795 [Burkholderiaceae bacterium]